MKWNAAMLTTNTLQIYLGPFKGCLLLDEGLPIKSERGCKLNKHHLVGSVILIVMQWKEQECSRSTGDALYI